MAISREAKLAVIVALGTRIIHILPAFGRGGARLGMTFVTFVAGIATSSAFGSLHHDVIKTSVSTRVT